MKTGQTQLFKTEFGGSEVNIRECQFVKKEFQLDYNPGDYSQKSANENDNSNEDEEDDFEEDDADDESG